MKAIQNIIHVQSVYLKSLYGKYFNQRIRNSLLRTQYKFKVSIRIDRQASGISTTVITIWFNLSIWNMPILFNRIQSVLWSIWSVVLTHLIQRTFQPTASLPRPTSEFLRKFVFCTIQVIFLYNPTAFQEIRSFSGPPNWFIIRFMTHETWIMSSFTSSLNHWWGSPILPHYFRFSI